MDMWREAQKTWKMKIYNGLHYWELWKEGCTEIVVNRIGWNSCPQHAQPSEPRCVKYNARQLSHHLDLYDRFQCFITRKIFFTMGLTYPFRTAAVRSPLRIGSIWTLRERFLKVNNALLPGLRKFLWLCQVIWNAAILAELSLLVRARKFADTSTTFCWKKLFEHKQLTNIFIFIVTELL